MSPESCFNSIQRGLGVVGGRKEAWREEEPERCCCRGGLVFVCVQAGWYLSNTGAFFDAVIVSLFLLLFLPASVVVSSFRQERVKDNFELVLWRINVKRLLLSIGTSSISAWTATRAIAALPYCGLTVPT